MANKLYNRVKMTVSGTPGTGTITLGSAFSNFFFTFAEAGAANGDVVSYVIEDGLDFEIGTGTYTSSGTTLSRDTVTLSKIGGTQGTTKITLTSAAVVKITVRKEDLSDLPLDLITGSGSVTATDFNRFIVIDKVTPAATTVNLPSSPTAGKWMVVKDGGNCAVAYPITVVSPDHNVEELSGALASSAIIDEDGLAVKYVFDGVSTWRIV